MQAQRNRRRPHGSGSLIVKGDTYYGKWRAHGRQVMRKIGPVRGPATSDGLTKAQAEARLRALMAEVTAPLVPERLTVREVADRLIREREALGRRPGTLRAYRSNLASRIAPALGDRQITKVTRRDIEDLRDRWLGEGLSPKYVANLLGLLHSIFGYAVSNGWAPQNPCERVISPKAVEEDTAIRFLDMTEVEALLRAVSDHANGRVQRVLYLAAVMSGLRQGELLALRWRDVDWAAQKIRVNRKVYRGHFGAPKTKRGRRAVPLADRLGGELDRLYRITAYDGDDDLVFANPLTGACFNGHTLTKAFGRAIRKAGVREITFHDLRHTFGTTMASKGVPMRTLQEWMGHEHITTTQIYADYAPSAHEVDLINAAFSDGMETSGAAERILVP